MARRTLIASILLHNNNQDYKLEILMKQSRAHNDVHVNVHVHLGSGLIVVS